MDSDSWNACLSSISKRYQSGFQSRSDVFMEFEEIDGDDEIREEFPCPFCSEYFDIIGLCCHIDDDHPVEAKNGRWEILRFHDFGSTEFVACADVKDNLSYLNSLTICNVQRKRKSRKSGSHSTLSLLRRELREGNLPPIFGNSSSLLSSNAVPDPLLSSFILPMADEFMTSEPVSLSDTSSTKNARQGNLLERNLLTPPLSIKDQEERMRRSEFVHDLLFSAIFDD
ncbi:hypothetical protein KSS87_020106 [Heliosperma pusillum]|nr:hypothetical protein KSS87_020106 [Heliosperma pusillum]